jgi:RimJ/RimL family protein N-acetyltransferase
MDYKSLPNKLKWSICLFLMIILLSGCSDEKTYEITESNSKVTELDDQLQLEWQYDISNHSNEDYYFTLVFPSYIQNALVTEVGIVRLPANSSNSGGVIVSAKKSGAEMTEETIESIKNGKLPFVEQILIGKTISLNP